MLSVCFTLESRYYIFYRTNETTLLNYKFYLLSVINDANSFLKKMIDIYKSKFSQYFKCHGKKGVCSVHLCENRIFIFSIDTNVSPLCNYS